MAAGPGGMAGCQPCRMSASAAASSRAGHARASALPWRTAWPCVRPRPQLRPGPARAALQAARLEAWLRANMAWDFRVEVLGEDEGDDEFAPVVVQLTAEQLQHLSA